MSVIQDLKSFFKLWDLRPFITEGFPQIWKSHGKRVLSGNIMESWLFGFYHGKIMEY